MWDERYSQPGFAYGTEPNEFLAIAANRIPAGPVLTLGEGESRNAAYLAGLGQCAIVVGRCGRRSVGRRGGRRRIGPGAGTRRTSHATSSALRCRPPAGPLLPNAHARLQPGRAA